ncbi:hypothetical protein G7034_00845 [Psychroflexus sp. C1]|uniref:VanZ-like domain-containing protein n=1 Tax=Psychroflexus maritimus TaxID=2714865 RepID=A0A967AAS5_9FLAO|nr:hypothetical protein [Psychroflexus maritimus]
MSIIYLSLMETDKLPSVSIPYIDKYVHFIEYAVFFASWFMYFYFALRKSFYHTFIFSFLISVFFGIIIEILQDRLTTHRSFDYGDILFNSLGALFSGIVLFILYTISKKKPGK